MRILQIIDSLEIGGAEKMAVNYANSLADAVEFSGLVATRKEGKLKGQINKKVAYLFLNKKSAADFGSVFRLRRFCKTHKIDYLHAHSTSFFTAFLVKLMLPSLKIIWHDHYGLSEFLSNRKSSVVKFTSYFFEGIISVNEQLKNWALAALHCKNVVYLPNFTTSNPAEKKETQLEGITNKKILCLANLRPQKDHFLLIEVAKKLNESHPEWTFHLIGNDFEDTYSNSIKSAISEAGLSQNIFIYGSRQDIQNCIEQAEICILTSKSEGLPVALLEYGMHKKAVLCTAVGEIPSIIQSGINGLTVPRSDSEAFYLSLMQLIDDANFRSSIGQALYTTLLESNSEKAVIAHYLNWLKEVA